MRNAKRSILVSVLGVPALSLALVGAAQGAGLGFQPWTDTRIQEAATGEAYSGQFPWTDSLKCMTNAAYCHRFPGEVIRTEQAEPYLGPHNWTDSLKCMTNAAYCHRFDVTPVKAEVTIR